MLANNHEDKVNQPDDPEAEEQTEDARNDLAVRDTGNYAADPRRYGDDCENYAHDVRKTKVIALCHDVSNSFKYFCIFIILCICLYVKYIPKNFL